MTTLHGQFACASASAAAFALFLLLAFPAGRPATARQNTATADSTQNAPTPVPSPVPTPAQTPAATGADSSGMVKLTVTVTDKAGRFVTGLSREAFSINEGKAQAELSYFSAEEEPQSVGVVFDVSRSMGRGALDFARGALVRFMRQAHPSNEYFILGFNRQTHLLADWTRDGKTIIEALNKLGHLKQTEVGTALYDALDAGVSKVGRGPQPKRVILLISDGRDNNSKSNFPKLRELIKRSDVLIYAVGFVDDKSVFSYGGREIIEGLTGPSGGRAYFPSTEAELDEAFARIALELHSQYVIGYRPAKAAADGKWRKHEIKVRPPVGWPRIHVRVREGYYAPAAASASP